MTLYKKLLGLAVGASMALSLGGCIAVDLNASDVVQEDLIGSVKLKFKLCANDETGNPHTGCVITTNNAEADNQAIGHALVAVRAPAGTIAPKSFTGRANDLDSEEVTFDRSPAYESELGRLTPAGDGLEWIGYRSTVYDYQADPDPMTASRWVTIDALRLGLPRAANGAPFATPFRYQVVAGGQKVTGSQPAGRAIDCGGDPFAPSDGGSTICIDHPVRGQIGTFNTEPVTDLGIAAGGGRLSPGQEIEVPFAARLNNGPPLPPGTSFAVTASTSIPGVKAVPSLRTFTPVPGSETRIKVPVAVPKRAGPGTFPVSVTAKLPNGQSRTGTGTVTIRDRQKPKLTKARIRPKYFRPSRRARKAANLSYIVNEAATVRARVQVCTRVRLGKCVRFKALKGTLARKSPKGSDTLHLSGYLRRKRLAPDLYRLVLTPIDLAGNRGKVVRVGFGIF